MLTVSNNTYYEIETTGQQSPVLWVVNSLRSCLWL